MTELEKWNIHKSTDGVSYVSQWTSDMPYIRWYTSFLFQMFTSKLKLWNWINSSYFVFRCSKSCFKDINELIVTFGHHETSRIPIIKLISWTGSQVNILNNNQPDLMIETSLYMTWNIVPWQIRIQIQSYWIFNHNHIWWCQKNVKHWHEDFIEYFIR